MNKEQPSASKLITYLDLKRNWNIHQQKVINIKSQICSQPTCLKSSRKTSRKPYSRIMDIQFENRSLLKKLTERNNSLSKNGIHTSFSLLKNNRKKYFEDFTRRIENQGILKRIRDTKTSYNLTKLQQSRKQIENTINLISKYPYKQLHPTKTLLKFQMPNHKAKCYHNTHQSTTNLNQSQSNERTIEINQKQAKCDKILRILPTKQKKFNNKNYHVKIIEFQTKIVIQISHQNEQDINCLQISQSMFRKKCNNKFKKLFDSISFNSKNCYFFIE